ncbi:MAG TPA: hypothetical protein DEG71_04635 [Clostridiales bacterium]|nr:hypothetical protein [Clostridiales bacterium]
MDHVVYLNAKADDHPTAIVYDYSIKILFVIGLGLFIRMYNYVMFDGIIKGGGDATETSENRLIWSREILGEKRMEYIRNLPLTHEMYISGSLVRFMHISPNSVYEKGAYIDDEYGKIKIFYPTEYTQSDKVADIVFYADMHQQLLQRFFYKTLINVGSVGTPIESLQNDEYNGDYLELTNAMYCIIEGDINEEKEKTGLGIQFVRVPYSIEGEIQLARDNDVIEIETYARELRTGESRVKDVINQKYKELRRNQAERYLK